MFAGLPRGPVGHQSCHPLPPTPSPHHCQQLLLCGHRCEEHLNPCSSSVFLALLASFWDVHFGHILTQDGAGSEFKLWSKKHVAKCSHLRHQGMVVMWAKSHLALHGENCNQKPRELCGHLSCAGTIALPPPNLHDA